MATRVHRIRYPVQQFPFPPQSIRCEFRAPIGAVPTTDIWSIVGDIDAYTVGDLMLRLAASLETGRPRVLVLDLTKVTFLAATAIHALDLFTEDAQARRTSVRIVAGPAGPARRSLLITGAFHSLVSFASLESARAA